MIWNNQHMIDQKEAAEELNFPNPFTQLQEEWAEQMSEKFEEDERKKENKKTSKLSPGAMKKLKEWRPL